MKEANSKVSHLNHPANLAQHHDWSGDIDYQVCDFSNRPFLDLLEKRTAYIIDSYLHSWWALDARVGDW